MICKICAVTTISKTMDWFVTESMRNVHKNDFQVSLMCDMDDDFIKRNSDYAKCINLPMKRGIDPIGAFKTIRAMYIVFKKEKFDIVQYSTPNASLYASIAAKLAGVKIRIYGQWGIRYVSFTGLKRYIFKTLEKLTCLMSTHVRGQSPMNRQFAIDEGLCPDNKITVLGIGGTIGVDFNEYDVSKKAQYRAEIRQKYDVSEDCFLFGYVGRLNADKGVNELLKAFKDISEDVQDTMLMLVGMVDDSNPIDDDLLKWAQSCPFVILTGNQPSHLVCKYMSAFDIYVHPTYREGFGKVLQEAMALALPIITTDVPGPSEVVERDISGILIPSANSKALKDAMLDLKMNPAYQTEISQAGYRRAVQYFARPKMLQNILDDYQKILGIKTEVEDEVYVVNS